MFTALNSCHLVNMYNINFNGKAETFWKTYNKSFNGIPLKTTIIDSISDSSNFLGEGLNKKGFAINKLNGYIVRINKNNFQTEDLNLNFTKSKRNFIDTVDGVVLRISNKIDIVKRKSGESIGVSNYGVKICPPMDNILVTREESLKALQVYEKMKDFPIESYKKAYAQLQLFCREKGYQLDIVNPNNILIDTKAKKINFIDPMDPKINKCLNNPINFAEYHGCDSIYPVLCDFLMHKEHLKNLTEHEKERWINSIQAIITKCIIAGKELGFKNNINNLKFLYGRIDKLWYTFKAVPERYDNFIKTYSDTINKANIISDACNYKNDTNIRLNAIKHLDSGSFDDIKPVFTQIIKAKHQPKVEIPEILNTTLDKIAEYGNDAKSILPDLEFLFDKEIFFPTKKRLYNLFINIDPSNKRFLEEMRKSANNLFEKNLYENEFANLKSKKDFVSDRKKSVIEAIYNQSQQGSKIPSEIIDKLWISRTCTNSNEAQQLSINNMIKAYQYIEANKNNIPQIQDLINIHKIALQDTPEQELIIGRIRTKENNYMFNKIFNIKRIPKIAINPYANSEDVLKELQKLIKYIEQNYNKDPYKMAAKIFMDLTWIHPFYNGNGRASRLFTEQFLLSKGIRMKAWPEATLYRKITSENQLAELIKQNSNII